MNLASTHPNRPAAGALLAVIGALSIASSALADPGRASKAAAVAVPTPAPVLTSNELLGQAPVDECFNGVGVDYPPLNPDGTCSQGKPKTNQSYIWGLTEESGKLWFGTVANAACLLDGHDVATAGVSNLFTCEFGASQYARTHPAIPDALGDWRPPRIYYYDLATSTLARRQISDPLINKTLGFRGAGSIGNIAFLAGQSLAGDSTNIFAFKADTGQYLGSCSRTDYTYIRQWRVVNNVLYVGVGSPTHGAVLRWDGNANSFRGNFCTAFTEVGRLSANAANVNVYQGADGQDRLAVTTVAIRTDGGDAVQSQSAKARAQGGRPGARRPAATGPSGTGVGVGVWISPPLGAGGLTSASVNGWRQVWSPSQYDPDPIVAQFGYSGGAVQSFDGWLYWGTIHLANSAAIRVHETCTLPVCFGMPDTPEEKEALEAGVYRTASVWRGRNLENAQTREIQLLYGETELPAVDGPKSFAMKSTGWTPLYGKSGFGNAANEYIWQMAVFDNRLFVGTYDASVLQGVAAETGADLWRFDSSSSPAVNENFTGLGDRLNYGIRAMTPLDDQSALILGMANPFNLAPGGGWELRRLKKAP